jgi:prophage tail gpP-like protein
MKLMIDGVQYSNFTSSTVNLRLDSLSSSFNFNAVLPDGEDLPFTAGSDCSVYIDDDKILTGYIEVISVSYDGGSHDISISGRDKTADLLDSSIDALSDINGGELTLKSIIEKVIDNIGADISVTDETDIDTFDESEDIAAPEPGDNAFEVCQRYAKKRQVIITSDYDGNVVITTNSGKKGDGVVQHIIGADDNNVISSNFTYDSTGRYNLYKVRSSLNPTATNYAGSTSIATTVDQSGSKEDTGIRDGRQYVIIPDASASDTYCQERANWEADLRRARGLIYSAVVPGFRIDPTDDDSDLWEVNKLYQIVDDFIGKVETMLCNSVTFNYSDEDGRTTTLGFVGKNAYTKLLTVDSDTSEATVVTGE